MMPSRLPRALVALPLAVALILALSVLGFTAAAALFDAHRGILAGEPPAGNFVGAARSYLFRSSLRNSVLAGTLVLAATAILAHQVLRTGHGRRAAWPVLGALAAAPLFLPGPAAALLWRPLAAELDLANHPDRAVALFAAALLWRLWPLVLLARPAAQRMGAERTALAVGLAACWIALIDAAGPLLLTGGGPYNASHGWASWAFHTVWVSRLWGHGAVMLGGLAAASALLGGAILYLAKLPPVAAKSEASRPVASFSALTAGAVVAIAPLALHAPDFHIREAAAVWAGLAQAGYFHWLANSVLVWLGAWLVAAAVGASVTGHGRRRWLTWLSLAVGMGVFPLWHFVPARVAALGEADSRLLLAVAAGISAGLIVHSLAGLRLLLRRSGGVMAGIVAGLLALNQLPAELVLEGGRRGYPLAAGMSLFLAENPLLTGERAWALLLTLAVAWLAAYGAVRSLADS